MEVFFVRHQQRGVLHDQPFATREEAEKAADLIRVTERARPAWLKKGAEWWCACVHEPTPPTKPDDGKAKANAAALPRLSNSGNGEVKNPKE